MSFLCLRVGKIWAAVREPKRKQKAKMLARRDGRIRAPRGIYRGSSKGQLTLFFEISAWSVPIRPPFFYFFARPNFLLISLKLGARFLVKCLFPR